MSRVYLIGCKHGKLDHKVFRYPKTIGSFFCLVKRLDFSSKMLFELNIFFMMTSIFVLDIQI